MWLFEDCEFYTRADCGSGWESWLVILHVVANLLVFSAYIVIPIALLRMRAWMRDKREAVGIIPPWIFVAFAAFIISCGIGHLFEVFVFWWAPYRLIGFWNLITGVTSWLTVIGLIIVAPKIIQHWSRIERDREALRLKCDELIENYDELLNDIQKITSKEDDGDSSSK